MKYGPFARAALLMCVVLASGCDVSRSGSGSTVNVSSTSGTVEICDKGGLSITSRGGTSINVNGGSVRINGESFKPETGGCVKVADGKVVQ